jgi:2-dehydro-3-deoxyglucarate aldolase
MIGHPAAAEILARAGFDWVVIDMEHGLVPWSGLMSHILAIKSQGSAALVRLPAQRKEYFQRALDTGADGVIVPNIRSAQDAAAARRAAKYAPEGRRGVGIARAHGFGPGFDSYVRRANDDTLLVFQIEDIQAMDALDEILETPGLDAILIGPYDLSGTMGLAGETRHPKVLAAIDDIVKKAHQHQIAPGIHLVEPNEAVLAEARRQGMQFIALGLDTLMLSQTAKQVHDFSRVINLK